MPHKHKRDKSKSDASLYDLPPSDVARPLPSTKPTNTKKPAPRKAHKKSQLQNDAPRAFTRLLNSYRPPRSGLDDGIRRSKKRKISEPSDPATAAPAPATVPSIQPNERLSSFAARVDAALPFSALSKKGGGSKESGKERQTKTERRMQRMQREWREEERRRKEKAEEEEDEELGEEIFDEGVGLATGKKIKGKKRKRGGGNSGVTGAEADEDPWAHIAVKRSQEIASKTAESSGRGLVGLHDVVLAPPKFSKIPREKNTDRLIVKGGLKKQNELEKARSSVVEVYRQMVREKRGEK
ncbi:hypothetical protein MMC28_011728 [Mycoblastus sanguinarius]|nr:hypothetical protein [Mycoblastus sanguinarius]